MAVYIANFGRENYAWKECLQRPSIATMNGVDVHDYWISGDKESYIEYCIRHYKTARGLTPVPATASRWFKLMSIITETQGDYWIHKDGDDIWWTLSKSEPAIFEPLTEPVSPNREVIICHKPCEEWRKKDALGRLLKWKSIHPKGRDFLSTESTLQRLSPKNAAYAIALIKGESLDDWHNSKDWKVKLAKSASKGGEVNVFTAWERALYRIAYTAFNTTKHADGGKVEKTKKVKNMGFSSQVELENYLANLAADQDYMCALTGLPFNREDDQEYTELNISLDRIDSDGHYEPGNLQIVCKFANRWKGADNNANFLDLIEQIRRYAQ
ncbi:hypothetical protein [Alteromonas sp. 009811495]|uniref:hypothetical protein n=1 Tax=Alteromonas sp. 009811495 TaxID=3002962 RepID=UPI00237EB969|nr:hypothetical protein [Alteromonas sp. 009811495]WDT85942.1 hypothetical protein OZ660_18730 [Alteromonas sp. 009811495]